MYVQPSDAFTAPIFSGVPTGAWQTLDISARVGAAARMCQLKVNAVRSVGFRAVGNSNDYEIGGVEHRGSANVLPALTEPGRGWVSTNSAGQFQFRSSNLDPVTLHLPGWMSSTPVWPGDNIGAAVAVSAAWTNLSLSGGPPTRALCLLGHKNDDATRVISLSPSDETQDIFEGVSAAGGTARHEGVVAGNDHFGSLVPVGPTGVLRGYSVGGGSVNVTTYVHGYDPDYVASGAELVAAAAPPTTFTTIDCTTDVTSSPTGVVGKTLVYLKIMRVAAGGIMTFAVRNSEDGEDYLPAVVLKPAGSVVVSMNGTKGGYVAVETNTSGEVQWAANVNTWPASVELVGYVPGAVLTSPTNSTSFTFTSWPAR